jgi:hypothetical protein
VLFLVLALCFDTTGGKFATFVTQQGVRKVNDKIDESYYQASGIFTPVLK